MTTTVPTPSYRPLEGSYDEMLDEAGRPPLDGAVEAVRPVGAQWIGTGGVAGEAAAGHGRDDRQHRSEGAHRGRLSGALLTANEHPADLRRHRVENQGQSHVVHTDDRAEREEGHRPTASDPADFRVR